jgi:arsenate reductase
MPTVLFLCVANSARSQMAEGLARALAPPGYRFLSAGSAPRVLNPLATAALAEIGIDISSHQAKGLESVALATVDLVVTLCAEEVCPVVPGHVRRLHWPLPDPAAVDGDENVRLDAFRKARDRLRELLPSLWERGERGAGSGTGR